MAKLPSLVTSNLTGEALNYYGSSQNIIVKQTFEVTKNQNYTWTVKSSLYIKLKDGISIGQAFDDLWLYIQGTYYDIGKKVEISPNGVLLVNPDSSYERLSNNGYEYTKVLENTKTINFSRTGRAGITLYCGWTYNSNRRLFDDYTYIYLTLPAFSGMFYKENGTYKRTMPLIKVNGVWQRTKQYVKVEGEWKEYNSTWVYNPEV